MNLDPALLQRIVDHADTVSAAMRQTLAHASFLSALGISFLAGLVFNFNPVSLAVMPTSLVYVTKARKARQVMALGGGADRWLSAVPRPDGSRRWVRGSGG